MTDGAELNLGEQRGDILNIDFTKLEDSHILLSGPPCLCKPAGNLNNSTNNEKVFHKVLQIIIYFAQRGLLAFTIEIGRGKFVRRNGRNTCLVRDALCAVLPGWYISIKIVDAQKVMLAQIGIASSLLV